jgi:hypothetical protein
VIFDFLNIGSAVVVILVEEIDVAKGKREGMGKKYFKKHPTDEKKWRTVMNDDKKLT